MSKKPRKTKVARAQADDLLEAVYELGGEHESVSVFDLTILAWRKNPTAFGLYGYRDRHPDSRVVSALVQHLLGRKANKSMSPKLLERIAPYQVKLTPLGLERIRKVRNGTMPYRFKPVDAGTI